MSTLHAPHYEVAQEKLKGPYISIFFGLEDEVQERCIENALAARITDFLLELGKGFAFVGRKVKLVVSDNEYFLNKQLPYCCLKMQTTGT